VARRSRRRQAPRPALRFRFPQGRVFPPGTGASIPRLQLQWPQDPRCAPDRRNWRTGRAQASQARRRYRSPIWPPCFEHGVADVCGAQLPLRQGQWPGAVGVLLGRGGPPNTPLAPAVADSVCQNARPDLAGRLRWPNLHRQRSHDRRGRRPRRLCSGSSVSTALGVAAATALGTPISSMVAALSFSFPLS